jgi:ribose-phosphate pyrophosphokinase
MESNAKLFSGTGSKYLAEKIAKRFGEPLGKVNIQTFSDGEIGVEFQESIRGQFVFFNSKYFFAYR